MEQFYLTETITKDKLIHQGIYFEPRLKGTTAILWIHGLTSTFYSHVSLMQALAHYGDKEGMGFAAFNNRGHDMLAGIRKRDKRSKKGYSHAPGGAGYEEFRDCIYDIAAGVDFLVKKGFSNVIVIGHSTGANKACYFGAKAHNPSVAGIILAAPMSDRLVPGSDTDLQRKELQHMKDLVAQGRGEELFVGRHFFPLTPKRYVSLFSPHGVEDTFGYGDTPVKMEAFESIRKPLYVLFAGDDEAADRPVTTIKQVFDSYARSQQYSSSIIPHAPHSFANYESQLVTAIISWVKGVTDARTF